MKSDVTLNRINRRAALGGWLGLLASIAIFLSGCNRGIDQKKFESVYRAGQAMRGATDVGLTLMRYRELLQSLASEVAIAQDRAKSEKETAMVAEFAKALECYRDAATMWALKIERGEGATMLTTSAPAVVPLIAKYGLTTDLEDPDYPTIRRFSPERAMQEIWVQATRAIAMANAMYTGRAQS